MIDCVPSGAQDEEEKQLGLPLTMFLQRDQPDKLPKVQLSFVQNLVSPLFQVCAQAHIIPGELVPLEVVDPPQGVPNERKWSSDAVPLEVPKETMDDSSEGDDFSPERKFTSVILDNLRVRTATERDAVVQCPKCGLWCCCVDSCVVVLTLMLLC